MKIDNLCYNRIPQSEVLTRVDLSQYLCLFRVTDRGNSSISRMPGCGPNALPKNWILFVQSVACI